MSRFASYMTSSAEHDEQLRMLSISHSLRCCYRTCSKPTISINSNSKFSSPWSLQLLVKLLRAFFVPLHFTID